MVQPRTWSDDDNAKLLQLEADNVPREEIAQRLRKTRAQVSAQIGKLRIRQDLRAIHAETAAAIAAEPVRRKQNNGSHGGWTPDEIERLLMLGCDRRLDEWPGIAAAHFPGRTPDACKQQYYERSRAARGVAPKAQSRQAAPDPSPKKTHVAVPAPALEPLSITAAILGDPLPGRSALDRRMDTAQ